MVRNVLCSSFNEFLTSYSVGCDEVIPAIRHKMLKEHWRAVARIILYGIWMAYFPLKLSQTFMISCLFGEEHVTIKMLVVSFQNDLSSEERQCSEKILKEYKEENKEDLLEVLSAYNCFKKPSKDSLFSILQELGHQELLQKPKYIANAFAEVFRYCPQLQNLFPRPKELSEFYKERAPTSLTVVKALKVNDLTDIQRSVLHFLHGFIKSLNQKDLCRFLKFVTGGDILPDHPIQVISTENIILAPRSRTCVPQLELQDTYNCYNKLAEESTNILKSSDSFLFSFI